MAKKKTAKPPARVKVKQAAVRDPSAKPKRTKSRKKKRTSSKTKVRQTELMPMKANAGTLIPTSKRNSLVAWLSLYMEIEGTAGSDNTIAAKKIDLTKLAQNWRSCHEPPPAAS